MSEAQGGINSDCAQVKNDALLAGPVWGQGPQRIPDCYKHGEELRAKFSVIDQFDNWHTADVVLYVDRSAQLRPRQPKKPRRSLICGGNLRF
jgi:hypothetical protein